MDRGIIIGKRDPSHLPSHQHRANKLSQRSRYDVFYLMVRLEGSNDAADVRATQVFSDRE